MYHNAYPGKPPFKEEVECSWEATMVPDAPLDMAGKSEGPPPIGPFALKTQIPIAGFYLLSSVRSRNSASRVISRNGGYEDREWLGDGESVGGCF